MQRDKMNQRGFTLLEFTIVLILVGVLVAAILIMAASVSRNSKEVRAAQEIIEITQNIRGLWGRVDNISGMTNANLITAKAFPADMIDNSTSPPTVRNPWNGTVNVLVDNINKRFSVQYNQVPTASCIELATNNVLAPEEIGLNSFAAGGTQWTQTQLPLTPATVTGPCSTAATVTMTWEFNVRG